MEEVLQGNEIVVMAYPVKYISVERGNGFITVAQNGTRRRVYDGWHFDDDGRRVWVSASACCFQHGRKGRRFIVDTVTKRWRELETVTVERHRPESIAPVGDNIINELRHG